MFLLRESACAKAIVLLRMRGNTIGGDKASLPRNQTSMSEKIANQNCLCTHPKVGITAGNLDLYNFATESAIGIILVQGVLE